VAILREVVELLWSALEVIKLALDPVVFCFLCK
jgi:hypothetical protein